MFEELFLRWQLQPCVPPDDQLTHSENCLILLLGDDSDKVFSNNHLFQAWNVPNRLFVNMGDGGPHLWWSHDATVKHSGHTDCLKELKLSRHQGSPVERRHRFAQHRPLCCGSPLGRPSERYVEPLASLDPLILNSP